MEGYTVTTAEDGETGWDKFLENTYQLIITDINMPKVNYPAAELRGIKD